MALEVEGVPAGLASGRLTNDTSYFGIPYYPPSPLTLPPHGSPWVKFICGQRSGNYLERQVAHNNRPLYPKVAYTGAKVPHNYRLLAFQVRQNQDEPMRGRPGSEELSKQQRSVILQISKAARAAFGFMGRILRRRCRP